MGRASQSNPPQPARRKSQPKQRANAVPSFVELLASGSGTPDVAESPRVAKLRLELKAIPTIEAANTRSNDYTGLLKANQIDISMSRKGNPWDNAACESFMNHVLTAIQPSFPWTRATRAILSELAET